ncbi:MAG TPA: pyridine nucleotide-disulfide oxidoreductase, partial [Alphaproteobacteria bacterium]|nr:pyridine nucleotide-disulfide oxidoreductase [Alphaproteobacteria bacterium]
AAAPPRAEDKSFAGSVAEAVLAYGRGALGEVGLALDGVRTVFALGPSALLSSLAAAKADGLAPLLGADVPLIGSFAAPMQCMMKEICGRCLQPVRDPASGKTRLVFACVDANLPLADADVASLDERLAQNGVQEKLTRRWIEHCLGELRMDASG